MQEFEDQDRDPLEMLAAEFMQRQRSGKHPSISEYTARNPELAGEIEELFPAIAAMERLKAQRGSQSGRATLGGPRLERLGDFRILSEIGRGGMGIVYEAFQESLGRHVAVKVLPRQALLDPRHLQRFQRESQTAARLHHTNIVPVFGVGEQDGFHYIVMQLIRGVGLDAVLSQLQQAGQGTAAAVPGDAPSASCSTKDAIRLAEMLVQGPFEPSRSSACSGAELLESETVPPLVAAPMSLHVEGQATSDSGQTPVDTLANGSAASAGAQGAASGAAMEARRFGSAYWRNVASIGLQVADALHYAHLHHTLHRDIKPANLLLDAQGVVWISDFGLAKVMEQTGVTHTGALVGTLRYMAPEQFSGQVDARSDLYSLGLTLYELLTLRPAFDDARRSSLIRKISHEEPDRPRKINPAIPRDLETVVLKAIASDPARRYPSAGELAHDLQRFLEDRPIEARRASPVERVWRWSRRNPLVASLTMSTLSLLALVALVASVGYVQTTRANVQEAQQRKKAEDTSALALEALDNIFQQFAPDRVPSASTLTVVGDSGEELAVPVQPVLSNEAAALLEHLLAFYDRLAVQGDDDVKLRRKVAEANRRVGDIRQRLGDHSRSKEAYLRAIALYRQLPTTAGDDADTRVQIARIHNELGNVYQATNAPQAAQTSYQEALSCLETASSGATASPSYAFELARTHYFLGKQPGPSLLAFNGPRGPRRGRPGPSALRGPEGRGFFEGLEGPRGPDGPDGRLGFRGPGPDGPGGPDGARDPRGPRPDGPHEAADWAAWLDDPGGLGRELEDVLRGPPWEENGQRGPRGGPRPPFPLMASAQREEYLQKAIALLERLVAENLAVPDYRLLLARCYCEAPRGPGRGPDPAAETVTKATQILQKLVEEYPDVPDYRYALSETYAMQDWRGLPGRGMDVRASPGRKPDGQTNERRKPELHQAGERGPDRRRFESHGFEEGEADRRAGDERSRAILKKALSVSEELVAKHPNIPEYAASQVFIRLRLAELDGDDDAQAAEANLRKALDLQLSLVRRYPQMSAYKFTLALIHESLADLLQEHERLPEAQSLLEDSVATLQEVLQGESTASPIQNVLAHHYRRLAEVLRQMGEEDGAQQALDKAQALRPGEGRGGMPPMPLGRPKNWGARTKDK